MLLARQGLWAMRFTCKSSTQMTPYELTILWLCWCVKFSLRKAIRSCTRATALRCFQRSGVHFTSLECLCWALVRAFSSFLKKRGFSISAPVERVAKVVSPTSIPTCSLFSGKRSGSHSTEKQTYHLPVDERWMVQVFTLPLMGRWYTILILPILERRTRLSWVILHPLCGKVNES